MVELHAVWEGLIYAINKLRASKIWIEGDFMIVVKWLSNPPLYNSRHHPLLHDY